MPDKLHSLITVLPIEIRLKRKYRGDLINTGGYRSNSTNPPRPYFWGYKINYLDPESTGSFRQAQIKIRIIYNQQDVWSPGLEQLGHLAERPNDTRRRANKFNKAHRRSGPVAIYVEQHTSRGGLGSRHASDLNSGGFNPKRTHHASEMLVS
jgi:hypothetical protein